MRSARSCCGAGSELQLELPPDAQIDVDQAAARARGARAALAARPGAAARTAEAALDIYEPGLVPTFDAPWLEEHRRPQEDERLEALELLAEASLALGGDGPMRAQLAARQLVELAPFRESGYALLMEAHAARGNQAEALQAFERVRVLLREELGSTPSAELRALHEQVLAASTEAGEAPGQALPLPAGPGEDRRPPVCRARERDGAAARARARRRRRAAVRAAAGRARHRQDQPGGGLRARGPRGGRDRALRALRRGGARPVPAVRGRDLAPRPDGRWTSSARAFGSSSRSSAGSCPAAPPGCRPRAPLGPAGDRALPAVRGRGDHAGARGGRGDLVLVFDDLHWADRPTLLLLRHLARAPEPSWCCVGSYRDVEVGGRLRRSPRWSPTSGASGRSSGSSLSGLDEDETEALIGPIRARRRQPGLAHRLHELTGGNPLFLEEIAARSDDLEGVPAGVREVGGARRVARLGAAATEMLGARAGRRARASPAALAPAGGLAPRGGRRRARPRRRRPAAQRASTGGRPGRPSPTR